MNTKTQNKEYYIQKYYKVFNQYRIFYYNNFLLFQLGFILNSSSYYVYPNIIIVVYAHKFFNYTFYKIHLDFLFFSLAFQAAIHYC